MTEEASIKQQPEPILAAQHWTAEKLRFTSFLAGQPSTDLQALWDKVVGQPPTKRIQEPAKGLDHLEADNQHEQVVLQQTPGRIDLLLLPKTDPGSDKPPSIASLDEALPRFGRLARTWLECAPELVRIALGAITRNGVETMSESASLLDRLLPYVDVDTGNIPDFKYRTNRMCTVDVYGSSHQLNRIAEWSLVTWSIMRGPAQSVVTGSIKPIHQLACQLETDTSTSAHRDSPLPRTDTLSILDLFLDWTMIVNENGDHA